eukprot:4973494-Pleurochrysis_carterae.AAC.1
MCARCERSEVHNTTCHAWTQSISRIAVTSNMSALHSSATGRRVQAQRNLELPRHVRIPAGSELPTRPRHCLATRGTFVASAVDPCHPLRTLRLRADASSFRPPV